MRSNTIKTLQLTLFLLLIGYNVFSQNMDFRKELFYNSFDLEASKKYFNKLAEQDYTTATITGYTGAACALIAKHAWNPVEKIKNLNNSKRLLEKAIQSDSNNIELRFLRYYIEKNIPSYLGYSKNIQEDRSAIIHLIPLINPTTLDPGIAQYIYEYLSDTKEFSNEELVALKKKLKLI